MDANTSMEFGFLSNLMFSALVSPQLILPTYWLGRPSNLLVSVSSVKTSTLVIGSLASLNALRTDSLVRISKVGLGEAWAAFAAFASILARFSAGFVPHDAARNVTKKNVVALIIVRIVHENRKISSRPRFSWPRSFLSGKVSDWFQSVRETLSLFVFTT